MPGTDPPAYPAEPWRMVGQMWLSLFRVGAAVDEQRPAGLHAVAFVAYEAGSPLTYAELLVAHPAGRLRATVTDIWVDSPASLAGGRALWSIPKGLADLTRGTAVRGPVHRTAWTACVAGQSVAQAHFTALPHVGPRLPFRAATVQPPVDGHLGTVTAPLRGSARVVPCRATWELDPAGPLGWLSGRRPLASCRLSDFRLTFGRTEGRTGG